MAFYNVMSCFMAFYNSKYCGFTVFNFFPTKGLFFPIRNYLKKIIAKLIYFTGYLNTLKKKTPHCAKYNG